MSANLVRLNSGFLNVSTNAPTTSCYDVTGANGEDQEPYGDIPLMQCLGVASLPYPPESDESGYAEGVLIEDVGGLPGIIVSAWDTRTFSLFGKLDAGDTVLHSTGPNQAAQFMCKEKKRQAIMAVKSANGEGAMVILDGENKKFQVLGWGLGIEMSEKEGIVLEAGSCRLTVHPDNGVGIQGAVTLGGMIPQPNMSMAVAPLSSWAALSTLVAATGQPPLIPIPNALGAL